MIPVFGLGRFAVLGQLGLKIQDSRASGVKDAYYHPYRCYCYR